MTEKHRWWVGIDWATADHQVCVLDASGGEVTQRVVAHTAVAVRGFVDWLRAHVGGDLGTVAVGIETPRGALVATLMEQGLAVYAVNPKQLDRFRACTGKLGLTTATTATSMFIGLFSTMAA